MAANAGIVHLVGAGPGDPELLTLKAVRLLRDADIVLYDRLINPEILLHASGAELVSVGKTRSEPSLTCKDQQDRIIDRMILEASQGRTVVRLKGGDPFVFGRGGEEALALVAAGIPFTVVSGVSSVTAASAAAGIPVTHRGLASGFAVFTGHEAESTDASSAVPFEAAAKIPTVVFLMGVEKLGVIVRELLHHGRAARTPVAIVERGTQESQKVVTGTLADILEKASDIRSPALIVVGEVVSLGKILQAGAAGAAFQRDVMWSR